MPQFSSYFVNEAALQANRYDGNLRCDPVGAYPDPAKTGHQSDPSVAWYGGDPSRETCRGIL